MFGLKSVLFGGEPRAYRQEIGGSWGGYSSAKSTALASGLTAGTSVATAMGWRPVEAIAKGDLVLTFDRGLRPVKAITFGRQWTGQGTCPPTLWPLMVPAGALGNTDDMVLLPEQCVMLESDSADMLFADPFSLVAAADLEGFRGIHRVCPHTDINVIQLHFDDDEVIFANNGALVFCPSLRVIDMAELMSVDPELARYSPLSPAETTLLLGHLQDEDDCEFHVLPRTIAPEPLVACA